MNDVIEQLFGDKEGRLTINQAERIAKRMVTAGCLAGNIQFDIVGPTGRIHCQWLDPDYGFFQQVGKDGFMRVVDLEMYHDLHVEQIKDAITAEHERERDE